MSLFSALDISYTGLNASQLEMNVTSQNISNANTEGYTRQRAIAVAKTPLHNVTPGDIGAGVKIAQIKRIHNEFVFSRLRDSSNSLEYNQFSKTTLDGIAGYFPDTDGVGLQNSIKNYFDAWNSFSSNPTSSAKKTALAQSTMTLSNNIQETRTQVRNSQNDLNNQLKINIDEVNSIGKKIADLNGQIGNVESIKGNNANDLRDQRDRLELSLSKLLNISVFKENLNSDTSVSPDLIDGGTKYTLNIAGESFVDGTSFHPLTIDNNGNKSAYYSVYYEAADGTKFNMTTKIQGGEIGAILDLRGRKIDSKTSYPEDGKLQGYIDDLDSFSKGLIQKTNSTYASSAVSKMISPQLNISANSGLLNNGYGFNKGSFDVVMYDNDGNEIGRKSINIDDSTTMNDIITQFNSNTDDNHDNDSTNDIDDNFTADYSNDILSFTPKSNNGYKIAIEDNGTNFAGVTGISSFFTGEDASNIDLKTEFKNDPTQINAFKAPVDGDNELANDMTQIQYHDISFESKDGTIINDKPDDFYRNLVTKVALDAQKSGRDTDTSKAIFNTVNNEQQSISGVNIDEELANLMKYQTAYGANAKIITTIDKMLSSLLAMKE